MLDYKDLFQMATTTGQSRGAWRSCLASACRTAVACFIVGTATLYGPPSLTRLVAFPAFSYVTVILIVTDATLGDTLHGCWLALYATLQSTAPAILTLWLIGPARLSSSTTALAVALAAFVVVVPRRTHLVAKRIALGQIVITYVIAFIDGEKINPVMHPLHVAASTALGVVACLLALLLPFPRLACFEVSENCKLFGDNASERLKLFVEAFCSEDNTSALASISQATCLTFSGTKLLQCVKRYQESVKWEFLGPRNYVNPGDKLQDIEVSLRGMEMALDNISSYPVGLKIELKECLRGLEEHISQTLKERSVPESNADDIITTSSVPTITPLNLPSFFFLFCMKLIQPKSLNGHISKEARWTESRVLSAFKSSVSLGLAVLFGSMYSKESGYWSGLPVAISYAASREATFMISNIKAQGTVLGTVYGVLGCFLFQRFLPVRFLSLLPWFILTDFLRRSRMYGQAGGISAVIGAVLILGRKNFGAPGEFAIARIVETFIGLSCSILVELVFEPTRAATLAKAELSKSLAALHECTDSVSGKADLLEKQRRLKMKVEELGKFIREADVEPNFWFLPFHSGFYGELFGSLSKTADIMLFLAHALGDLESAMQKSAVEKVNQHVELLTKMVGASVKCFEEVISVKSVAWLEKELETKIVSRDVELGKPSWSHRGDEEILEKHVNGYMEHAREVVEKMHESVEGGDEEVKRQVVVSLGAIGFCMSSLVRETKEIEKAVSQLVQWENPSSQINLFDISCKIYALYNI